MFSPARFPKTNVSRPAFPPILLAPWIPPAISPAAQIPSTQAHDKVSQIEKMMSMDKYSDEESQKKLQTYLDAANKEATYADDNLSKTYQQFISNFDGYLNKVNVAHTNVGGLQQRVELTKTRVENQKETVEELKSNNDNRDISDIIIDYYAAYNAYTSSLTAASKVGSQTLLNYL